MRTTSTMAALLVAGFTLDCGSSQQPAVNCADPEIVNYPPPPAEIEYPGIRREAPCTWMDGSWEWVGRRWQWKPGGWVEVPSGCVPAGAAIIWLQSENRGVLYYRPPSYCPIRDTSDAKSRARCANPKPCGASPSTASSTPPAPSATPDAGSP